MAQKANPTKLRLKKRLNWLNISCVHNLNDYQNTVLNLSNVTNANHKIFANLGIKQANINTVKTSKRYKTNLFFVDPRFLFYFTKLVFYPKLGQGKTILDLYRFMTKYTQLWNIIFNFFFFTRKQLINKSTAFNQKSIFKFFMFKKPYFLLSPKIIVEFIKSHISEIAKPKNLMLKGSFNKNIQKFVLKFVSLLLVNLNIKILGFKLIFSGKWKKTKTGRKQKLYLKYGRIQTSNITNKIWYYNDNLTTKHGVISIKLWLAQN